MGIPAKTYGGERNQYKRKPTQAPVTDISWLLGFGFLEKLKAALPEEVNFELSSSTTAVFNHTNEAGDSVARSAYVIDLYPLDVELTEEEVTLIIKRMGMVDLEEVPILSEMVDEHIQNIVEEVARVKKYHPTSKLTIIFGPADTIYSVGYPADPISGFLETSNGFTQLQTESCFIVLPNNVTSLTYGLSC